MQVVLAVESNAKLTFDYVILSALARYVCVHVYMCVMGLWLQVISWCLWSSLLLHDAVIWLVSNHTH